MLQNITPKKTKKTEKHSKTRKKNRYAKTKIKLNIYYYNI